MRRAFTLVELLVVVVVIVTLMAVTFRLGSVGSQSTFKSRTVNRMQRLENCLSGYYAAYGSYPPVALHGSRDYTFAVDGHGIQQVGTGSGGGRHEPDLDWKRVEAACRSQPVGMSFPFSSQDVASYVEEISRLLMEKANSNEARYKSFRDNEALKYGFFALTGNSQIQNKSKYSSWSQVQVFKLGLMSYLLPRLLVIFNVQSGSGSAPSGFSQLFSNQNQWIKFNELPCDFSTGQPYQSWDDVIHDMWSKSDRWKIAALPSQAVCARWMPNLEGIVAGASYSRMFYGVRPYDTVHGSYVVSADTVNPALYSAGESQSGGDNYSQQYLLDNMTVLDGWAREFYYYSPSPHQSYTLWSAGPNGRTFPPWVTDEELSQLKSSDRSKAQSWIADDIVHMKN